MRLMTYSFARHESLALSRVVRTSRGGSRKNINSKTRSPDRGGTQTGLKAKSFDVVFKLPWA